MPELYPLDFAVFKQRRTEFIRKIKEKYADVGTVLLFANFEQETVIFKQDSSFYYLTGIEEPAAALSLDLDTERATVWVPNFGKERLKWVSDAIEPNDAYKERLHVDAIVVLGEPCHGYQCHPFFTAREYGFLLKQIEKWISEGQKIYTFNPSTSYAYVDQRFIVQRIAKLIPALEQHLVDVSLLIAQMRRKKTNRELELLYKALEITYDAQEAAARVIKQGIIEYEVQAAIEYTFIASGGSIAFPSIVGSGKNSTILHYNANNATMKKGDLVVIDIGAAFNHYCADITRTYPVSGKFTKRQRELYDLVLDTQEYIASIAKPGMWLSNKEHAEQSLNHLAKKYLQEKGYEKYFPHGIGHFLGLDVHDVGDYNEPLQPGDVITIEPGIYIPEEATGIRIEDNYWIIEDGIVCLSEQLPKTADDIEAMMKYNLDE